MKKTKSYKSSKIRRKRFFKPPVLPRRNMHHIPSFVFCCLCLFTGVPIEFQSKYYKPPEEPGRLHDPPAGVATPPGPSTIGSPASSPPRPQQQQEQQEAEEETESDRTNQVVIVLDNLFTYDQSSGCFFIFSVRFNRFDMGSSCTSPYVPFLRAEQAPHNFS
jgi:hypothetical protein